MAAPVLRPYQDKVVERAYARIAAGRRCLIIVAPTGAGKTVILSKMVLDAIKAGKRVLIIVHRRELILQTRQKLFAMGIDCGIIAAGFAARPGEAVQIASVQSLFVRAIRSSSIDLPPADIVAADECHHATAKTWRRIIESYPAAVVLGLTATPCRGDGRGLGAIFETMVECPSIAELINAGYLVGTKVYTTPQKPDLRGVRIDAGDFNLKQLAERTDLPQLVGDVVVHWLRHGAGRKTVVFATSVPHAVHLAAEFNNAGIAAAYISGETPTDERDAVLGRLASGALDVVVNCQVLTEGFDLPEIGCIVLARATKSFPLYRQMLGRGLRAASGKTDCIVIDHAGCTIEHGLIDEPVEWTLADDKRAQRPMQIARAEGRVPKLAECPECTAIRWAGKPCSACGWRPRPRPEGVEFVEGDLVPHQRGAKPKAKEYTLVEKQRFYARLLYFARQRGYKDGWAFFKYQEKFGLRPAGPVVNVAPMPTTPEVAAWVKSRQIAYHMALKKAAA